jgi:O-antigen ligase
VQHINRANKSWLFSYVAALLLPWGLIFSRGLAEACVAIIGLLFLIESFRCKNWQWLRDPVVKIGLLTWGWLLLTSFFATNPLEAFSLAAPWIRYLLLYAALRSWILIQKESLLLFSKIMAIMLCLVIIDTIWQYIVGTSLTGHLRDSSGRLTGPMDNVKVGIFMAKMLVPCIGILLFFAAIQQNYRLLSIATALLFTAIATIMITGERTAFASTVIGFFTAAILLALSEKKLRGLALGGMIIIILAAGFLFYTQGWVQDRAQQFYSTISSYPVTEYGQLAKAGILMGQDHLLTGAGLKGFRALCPDLLAAGKVTVCNLHPHNPYLEWFAETGIMGLLLFISLVLCLFITAIKNFIKQNGTERLLPALVLACLIINFFPFMPTQSIFSNWPTILLWYSVSVTLSALNVLKENNAHPSYL